MARPKKRRKKTTTATSIALDYHQPVFMELHESHGVAMERALLDEPRMWSQERWGLVPNGHYTGESAWDLLYSYLDSLEGRIADIVKSHSLYFWQHLYRRIGVQLHSGHTHKTDSQTIGLVRDIVELAFVKYGQLIGPDDPKAELQLAGNVRDDEVLGGLLADLVRRRPSLQKWMSQLRRQSSWVITRFEPSDLENIYRLEGLAYEYWLTTTRLRSVGKGAPLYVSDGRLACVHGTPQASLEMSYDLRSEREHFTSSNIGVGFFRDDADRSGLILLATYNIRRQSLHDVASIFPVVKDMTNTTPNFTYGGTDIAAYYRAHAFLETDFRAEKNYGLGSLIAFIHAISLHSFNLAICGSWKERVRETRQLYQRAIMTFESHSYAETVTSLAEGWARETLAVDPGQVAADANAVLSALTISNHARAGRGLWSHGPRFALIPYGQATIVDLAALYPILESAFFRVRHNQTARGVAFEDAFRNLVSSAGLRLLPDRILKNDAGERETDAAVAVSDTLYLCDCRSIERPLDHEIGRPKTMAKRREFLEEKIANVLSMMEFVKRGPRGRNYDFTGVSRIVGLAVSPFVEYVWAEGDRYWIDAHTPRLLSAQEAVEFMAGRPLR